jgi:glutamyl-tRNA reductase
MELCAIGLNHRTTPLEFRERFSIPAERVPSILGQLREQLGLAEVVVLSTCNRLEIYAVKQDGPICSEQIFEALYSDRPQGQQTVDFQQVQPCIYVHKNEACVRHLLRVASSLDSLVVGETEIVGQVKRAYQLAQSSGATGKVLNRLFQKALATSKEVRTASGIGRCSTSVGSVALDLAMKIFGEDLSQRTILIIGAGKIGETTLKHLTKHGAKSVLVTNRSFERALELVSRFQGQAVPFEELPQALAQADIVISSTSAPHYVLTPSEVSPAMAQRPDRPLLLIDLAVPRDIDPAVLKLSSVYLYNIDQLAEIGRINMERRQTEAAACEQLVNEHAREVSAAILNPKPACVRGKPAPTGQFRPRPTAVAPRLEPVALEFA